MAVVIKMGDVITLHFESARRDQVMTLLATQPRPRTDISCRGQHAPGERVALAASLYAARGVQLTALRRQILELMWKSGRAKGAYELIEVLKLRNLASGAA
jgi:hypothetical protein